MDQAEFQDWSSVSGRRASAQRAEAARALLTEADEERSVAAVERGGGESRICPRCARSTGLSHIALNQSAGPRIRGLCRIQTAGNRQSRFKGFLFRHRGISTRCLGNCLQRCQLARLDRNASPSTCLGAAVNSTCVRFAK